MKIRYLSLIVLLVMSVFAPMQAQTYDNLWKELEVLERKDLPKSVISEAMKIYDKAKAEQNVPQMMKDYIAYTAKSSRQSRCASLWKLSASRKRTYRNGSECITIRQHPDLLPSLP